MWHWQAEAKQASSCNQLSYQLTCYLPCLTDQSLQDIMKQARGSATATPVALLFMTGRVCRRGERGRKLAKTWPLAVLVCFHLSLSYHHRFPMFLVKKKNGWASHFMFSSFLVLIRQELQAFGGNLYSRQKRVWKKRSIALLGTSGESFKVEKKCSLLHGNAGYTSAEVYEGLVIPPSCTPSCQVFVSVRLLPVALAHNGHCCIHLVK